MYDQEGYRREIDRRMALMRKIQETNSWAAALATYSDDPAGFISDWGWTYDPRNVEIGLPAHIPFQLFPIQRKYVNWLKERWESREDGLCDKSRDMGASWLAMSFAVWMWRFRPGAAIGIGSRKEEYVDNADDPKSLLWMARTFIAKLPGPFLPRGWDEKRHAPFMKIINPESGSSIIGEAGDNIGRGARTSFYLIDESAFLERPAKTDAALSNTTNCRVDVSTPNGPANPFAVKRRSGKVKVFTLHWRDDPRKGEAWYAKMKDKLPPPILAQEVDIDYEASSDDTLISGLLVDDAQNIGKTDVSANGLLQFGVDVARYGNDETVITLRKGRAVLWQKVSRNRSVPDVAGAVRAEVIRLGEEKVAQIAVDDIGVGGGVTDLLREWFRDRKNFVAGVNVAIRVQDGINYNLRAQAYTALADWLADGPVSLPRDPELKSQLTAIKQNFRGGMRLIESKDDMRKRGVASPDRADSLMLTFAVPPAALPRQKRRTTSDWAPLDDVAGY